MGAAENRAKSQKNAEDLKSRGVRRTSGQCPWGCDSTYGINIAGTGSGQSLMNHLTKCKGGGARRLSRQQRRR